MSHANSGRAMRDSSCLTRLHFHRDVLRHRSVFLGRCKNNTRAICIIWSTKCEVAHTLPASQSCYQDTSSSGTQTSYAAQINEICWIISGHGFRVSFQPEQASALTHCTALLSASTKERQQHDWLVQLQHTSNNSNLLWNDTLREDNCEPYTCSEHQQWGAFSNLFISTNCLLFAAKNKHAGTKSYT